MSEWQPIESAPKKDGVRLLMYGWDNTIGYWSDHFGWVDEAEDVGDESWPNRFRQFEPTHWMPLPPSPHALHEHQRDKPDEGEQG